MCVPECVKLNFCEEGSVSMSVSTNVTCHTFTCTSPFWTVAASSCSFGKQGSCDFQFSGPECVCVYVCVCRWEGWWLCFSAYVCIFQVYCCVRSIVCLVTHVQKKTRTSKIKKSDVAVMAYSLQAQHHNMASCQLQLVSGEQLTDFAMLFQLFVFRLIHHNEKKCWKSKTTWRFCYTITLFLHIPRVSLLCFLACIDLMNV